MICDYVIRFPFHRENNPCVNIIMDVGNTLDPGGAFTPASLANLYAWYDASDASTITLNGGNVEQWDDKSGNARHISQSTAGSRPSYASNTVSFDGTDDYLYNTSPFMWTAGGDAGSGVEAGVGNGLDIYIVAKLNHTNNKKFLSEGSTTDANPTYVPIMTQNANSNPSEYAAFVRRDGGGVRVASSTLLSPSGAVDNTLQIYNLRDNGLTLAGRVDGGSATSTTIDRVGPPAAVLSNQDRFAMGAWVRSSAIDHIDADVNEVIITAIVDDATRDQIESYLNNKWSVF